MTQKSKSQIIATGAEIIARAAMHAGCNFFAGYPITPTSSVYSAMLSKLQAEGKIAIGASDEISGISMCIGAAMRGAKAMTASAAPGLSLMIENIGYAFATETPLVIVLGQRLGPSTGAATQNAEGDISLIANLISGGYQIPVLAINSIEESYATTLRAFNLAETLRTPVILLSEKDLLMSSRNIDLALLEKYQQEIPVINRKYFNFDSKQAFKTYGFNELEGVPDFVQAGSQLGSRVVITGSMHDQEGRLSKDSPEAYEVLEHLRAKIQNRIDEYSYHELSEHSSINPEHKICLLSFLASDLASKEAVSKLRELYPKHQIKHLSLQTLFPIPHNLIETSLQDCDCVFVVEENQSGQYADMLKTRIPIHRINKTAGLISPKQIIQAYQEELKL